MFCSTSLSCVDDTHSRTYTQIHFRHTHAQTQIRRARLREPYIITKDNRVIESRRQVRRSTTIDMGSPFCPDANCHIDLSEEACLLDNVWLR